MSQLLAWELIETTLYFNGTLDRDSLMSFWNKKESSLEHTESIDVSGLKHVDSTGLAMLVRLKGEFQAKNRSLNITGVSDNLKTLIKLYGVQEVILN